MTPLKSKSLPLLNTICLSEGIKIALKESEIDTSLTPLTVSFCAIKSIEILAESREIRFAFEATKNLSKSFLANCTWA